MRRVGSIVNFLVTRQLIRLEKLNKRDRLCWGQDTDNEEKRIINHRQHLSDHQTDSTGILFLLYNSAFPRWQVSSSQQQLCTVMTPRTFKQSESLFLSPVSLLCTLNVQNVTKHQSLFSLRDLVNIEVRNFLCEHVWKRINFVTIYISYFTVLIKYEDSVGG